MREEGNEKKGRRNFLIFAKMRKFLRPFFSFAGVEGKLHHIGFRHQ